MDYSYDYSYNATGAEEGLVAGIFAAMAGLWLIFLVLGIVSLIAMWKIFEKAGKPGWAALVPVYNLIVLLEIVGRPSWWVVLYLLAVIPVVNFIGWIPALVVMILVTIDLAKVFGKDTGFAILTILFPYVMYPVLGFGKAEYKGVAAPAPATTEEVK